MLLKIALEVLLCAIVVVGAVLGIKRGFVSIAAKPVKIIAAIAISVSLYATVSSAIVFPVIEAPVTNYISEFLYENCATIPAENVTEELPTLLKMAAGLANVDVENVASNAGAAVLDAIVEHLTAPVLNVISGLISFILVYFVASILLSIALWFLNLLFKDGVLGALNKFLGFVFGTSLFLIIAWGLAVVIELVFHLPAFESNELISTFEGGWIYRFFNTYNPIELLLSF